MDIDSQCRLQRKTKTSTLFAHCLDGGKTESPPSAAPAQPMPAVPSRYPAASHAPRIDPTTSGAYVQIAYLTTTHPRIWEKNTAVSLQKGRT